MLQLQPFPKPGEPENTVSHRGPFRTRGMHPGTQKSPKRHPNCTQNRLSNADRFSQNNRWPVLLENKIHHCGPGVPRIHFCKDVTFPNMDIMAKARQHTSNRHPKLAQNDRFWAPGSHLEATVPPESLITLYLCLSKSPTEDHLDPQGGPWYPKYPKKAS